jgi:hypothetical protein
MSGPINARPHPTEAECAVSETLQSPASLQATASATHGRQRAHNILTRPLTPH